MRDLFAKQKPFWIVTLISTVIVLIITTVIFFEYNQTKQWQYLIMDGIIGTVLLTHIIAIWLATTKKYFQGSLWLISTAKVLGIITTPFFLTNYWFLGLVMLIAIPLEIGIAGQLKRIPLFSILALIGASAMVSIDLLTNSNGLTIINPDPTLMSLTIGLILLHIILLIGLLWYFRLRTEAEYYVQPSLTTQLSLVFILISAISISIITSVLINQIEEVQTTKVGENFQSIAEIEAERIGNILERQITDLAHLGQEPNIIARLEEINANYPKGKLNLKSFMLTQEYNWQSSNENSNFVLQYRTGPAVLALAAFRGTHNSHINLFVTGKTGGLVAAHGEKPANFFYGEQDWWQNSWYLGQNGVYIGQLTVDKKTEILSTLIAVRIINPKTFLPVGILASTYEIQSIQQVINITNETSPYELFLLSPDGLILAGTNNDDVGKYAWFQLFKKKILSVGLNNHSGWVLENDNKNQVAILAYSNLNSSSQLNTDSIRNLGWHIIVSDTQENALVEVRRSTKVTSLFGLLVMAGVILAAMVTAKVISRPIEALTETARAINEGHFELQANPSGSSEMITLAKAFNNLTANQNNLINDLRRSKNKYRTLNDVLQDELNLARKIQFSLLPSSYPKWNKVDIICYTSPAREIGGDFYSYHAFDDHHYALTVGDISGKGVSAALIMAASLAQLDASFSKDMTPAERLAYLDMMILPYTKNRYLNCALSYVELNLTPTSNSLKAVNAGCIPPYIKQTDGTVQTPDIGGFALGQGLGAKEGYQEASLSLSKGDTIIIVSDGVIEANNSAGDMFGFERFKETVASAPNGNAKLILKYLLSEINSFTKEEEAHDDLTIMVAQIKSNGRPSN